MFDKKKNPIQSQEPSPTDPLGSYTGVADTEDEVPEQDADDL